MSEKLEEVERLTEDEEPDVESCPPPAKERRQTEKKGKENKTTEKNGKGN